jgi:hypothetical protein
VKTAVREAVRTKVGEGAAGVVVGVGVVGVAGQGLGIVSTNGRQQ